MEESGGWSEVRNDKRLRNIVLLLLGLYFLTNLILRLLISPSLAFDESEMVVVSQAPAWGYKTPPPLYPLLQAAFFSLFGVSVFSLALLKNLILFGIYFSLYLCAKQVLEDERSSLLAALSLFLIPTFVWEALRSQAQSVLATLMACVTLLFILRLLKSPSAANYLGLGLAAGAGILSYYNFAAFAAALGLAWLSTPVGRKRLLDWKSGLILLPFLVVVAPHGFWLLKNLGYTSVVVAKLNPEQSMGALTIFVRGLSSVFVAALYFVGPLILCYYVFLKKTEEPRLSPELSQIHSILGRALAIALLICLVVVAATRGTRFKDRWLEPIFFFAPVYFLTVFNGSANTSRFKRIAMVTSFSAILSLTILHVRIPWAGLNERAFPLNYPAPDIAGEIRKSGFSQGAIVTENQVLGGNLRLNFRDSEVIVPSLTMDNPCVRRPVLVAWEASENQPIPDFLADYVFRNFGVNPAEVQPRFATALSLYAKKKRATLAFIQLAPPGTR